MTKYTLIFAIFLCTSQTYGQTYSDFKSPIIPISLSFDTIKKLQVFENMYVFGWDYFKREPPYLWNPNYKLSSEDTSRVIYNTYESRKSKVLNIETTNILLDTSNKTIIIEGFVTGGWYGAGSIVKIVVGEIVDTLRPQYEMSFSPQMDREYIQERKSVSGNYKCRFSANKNASKSASLISDLQRNKIIKNDNFNDCFLLKTSFPESQKTLPFSFSRSSINCLIRKINGQPGTCQGHVNARLCAQCNPMGTLDRFLAVQRKSY